MPPFFSTNEPNNYVLGAAYEIAGDMLRSEAIPLSYSE
jgi:hypothetical protein